MTCFYKRLSRLIACIILVVFNNAAKAQAPLIQNAIDKLESYKNFSYQYIYKQKEVFSDTLIIKQKFALLKAPEDKETGYFFKHESDPSAPGLPPADLQLYNGKGLVLLDPTDSTYEVSARQVAIFAGSLPGELNWLKTFLKKNPSRIITSNDTVFHAVDSYHLIINTKDTIVNNEHLYTRIHLFINKTTGLPVGKLIKARTDQLGKEATDYYTEESYFNFTFNQDNINPEYFALPAGYHLPKAKTKQETNLLTPLAPGTTAPNFTLYDTDGKKATLATMSGKIIMLDFFFVGCAPCMSALAPLDRLHEKYKSKNFVLLSISDRDSKKLLTMFKKVQRVKNQIYPDGINVTKSYQVTAAPTFYIIDPHGKIASVVIGLPDDFEQKTAAVIEKLLTN